MPSSETALKELMCCVLGDLLEEGTEMKLADDLYCGGGTQTNLLNNWERVLHVCALYQCNLHLSLSKTIINPQSTTVLVYIWNAGILKASPHRIAMLASCPAPKTVNQLRSFSGACKILSHVVPRCSAL